MKPSHPFRLMPYHNPSNADESEVPPRWRFAYEGETPTRGFLRMGRCTWMRFTRSPRTHYYRTLIVPVSA